MDQNSYFTRVPDALYDALRDGEITPLMFNIMLHLHHWADWNTGVVRVCNAKRLCAAMGGHHDDEVAAERTIQRAMQGLDEAGWIISGYARGMKQPYGVQITNFQPAADADGEKALIIPMPTKHWKETSAFQGADEGAEKALTQAVKRRLKELDSIQDSSTQDSSPDSTHETKPTSKQKKEVRKQQVVSPSAQLAVVRPSENPLGEEDGMYAQASQNQPQRPPQPEEEAIWSDRSNGWITLEMQCLGLRWLDAIFPATQHSVSRAVAMYDCLLALGKAGIPSEWKQTYFGKLLEYNRMHQTQDRFVIRGPEKFANALWSKSEDGLLAREATHDDTCRLCSKLGYSKAYEKFDIQQLEERTAREEMATRSITCLTPKCYNRLVVPHGWDAAKSSGKDGIPKVRCAQCQALYVVPDEILQIVCPEYWEELVARGSQQADSAVGVL
jgi:hypothetical protein